MWKYFVRINSRMNFPQIISIVLITISKNVISQTSLKDLISEVDHADLNKKN